MSKNRAKILGVSSFTNAISNLRKSLMFHIVCKHGENICYRCTLPIENINEFTIEHKIPWMGSDDPKKFFFDLDNIAFSHNVCNIKAGRPPIKCPSRTSYMKGCRCEGCIKANSNYEKVYRKEYNKTEKSKEYQKNYQKEYRKKNIAENKKCVEK